MSCENDKIKIICIVWFIFRFLSNLKNLGLSLAYISQPHTVSPHIYFLAVMNANYMNPQLHAIKEREHTSLINVLMHFNNSWTKAFFKFIDRSLPSSEYEENYRF